MPLCWCLSRGIWNHVQDLRFVWKCGHFLEGRRDGDRVTSVPRREGKGNVSPFLCVSEVEN